MREQLKLNFPESSKLPICAYAGLTAGVSLRGIVGCEESQAVTKAFRKLGHDFYSCDIQECSGGHPEWHLQGNIFHILHRYVAGLDIFIGHPPCTYLANSGVHHLVSKKEKPGFTWSEKYQIYMNMDRYEKMRSAAIFFKSLLHTNAIHICLENPIMHKYALEIIGEKHTQVIQPYQFGHPESKATCLWLKNLPELKPTNILTKPDCGYWDNQTASGQNKLPPSKDRAKLRSKTYPGIAQAMAEQWSFYACG
jgi:hypothetical protein